MSEREERDIQKVRLRLIDIVKSFFTGEPDAEKLSRWRGTFAALARERINPSFDRSVRDINQCLEHHSLGQLQEEYYRLFVDPFADRQVSTSASFYIDGKTHGQTLVELREMMAGLGIEKKQGVTETEDSMVIMLDILAALIDGSIDIPMEDSEEVQAALLRRYLFPVSLRIQEAFGDNEQSQFYCACSRFFGGYLELEKGLCGIEATH